ncbi:MAG: leucyl aminopeptidase [Candidatus Cloacimonetes bacterium]|nr:leucyl aminopeptidase [Candidatus Cloacimonadota bacterium]
MRAAFTSVGLGKLKTDLYVLPVFKDLAPDATSLGQLAAFGISGRLSGADFRGNAGERLLLFPAGKSTIARVMLLGLGESKDFTAQVWRETVGELGIWLQGRELADCVLELPALETGPEAGQLAMGAGKSLGLGAFTFDHHRSGGTPKGKGLSSCSLRAGGKRQPALEAAFLQALVLAEGANTARTLASEPGNLATPVWLGQQARRIAKAAGSSVSVTVFDEAKLKSLGCGGILGVGQGSRQPSTMSVFHYTCGNPKAPTVAFVGKGVTFDTGGISIKPALNMEDMKYDMCGAAAVFGLFSVIHQLKPKVNVVGVVPSAENMPDGNALRPGDIIRLFNGKTVEVLNTDAEGRLLLADAIAWVEKTHSPDAIVDFATLTGAMLICLGREMSGVFGNDPGLLDAVVEAGTCSGDLCWPLPLTEPYCRMVKSKVADIRNHTNSREGGSITAAAFLKEALMENTPWVHVDIAGTATRNVNREGCVPGATGVGVHLAFELLKHFE